MQVKTIMAATMLVLSSFMVKAQPNEKQGPPKPPPAEERWKRDVGIIKKHVTAVSEKQEAELKTVFLNFYKQMDAIHEKNKGQRPPKEEMDKIKSSRDEQLKKSLSTTQMEQFKKAEEELRPKPRGDKHQAPPPNSK